MPDSTDEPYGDWGKISDDLFGKIAKRLDLTNAVRLVACSKDFLRQVVGLRHWYGPYLLMPDDARWHCEADRMHDTVYNVVPLDHPRRTAILSFMANSFWVGMNGDWMAVINLSGNWFLANVYTHHQIPLPSSSTCSIWRDASNHDICLHPERYYQKRWFACLNLMEIVIYEVPTKAGQYADYKLIALFDRGLAYLEGGSQEWKFLSCAHLNACVECSDAIEHGDIIFAVDATDGSMYCWDPAAGDANLALPLVITSPHGFLNLPDVPEGRYYLARSADGEHLMITFELGRRCSYGIRGPPDILHDQNGLLLCEYRASDMLVFEKDPSSVGPCVFIWRRVYSLGTHSLFLGINYPMNVKIHDGQTPDGTLNPFLRTNCVYGSYYGFSEIAYPFISRWKLQPGKEEPMGVISLPPDGWGKTPTDSDVVQA